MAILRFPFPLVHLAVALIFIIPITAIDRTTCIANIRSKITNHTLYANDTTFFSSVPASLDPNTPLYLHATTCRAQCGKGFTWYNRNEISGNIVGWLIPVLVLVGNVHMPPLAAIYKVFSLLHFVGDPMDSMFSLQYTLGMRHAAYGWAKGVVTRLGIQVDPRDLAAVFWALDTLDAGAERTPIDVLTPLLHLAELPYAVAEAAADIRNTTVKEAQRTFLAIVVYVGTVAGAFIKSATNASLCGTKPGNRIAFAMLFSWLLPAILLSTFAARFTTPDACVRAIRRFTKHLEMPEDSLLPQVYGSHALFRKSRTSSVHEAAPYSGAIYLYRQRKRLFRRPFQHFPAPFPMLVLSIVPVVIAMGTAVAISYNTPTVGIGCRSITEILICTLWLLSFLFTILLRKSGLVTGKYHLMVVALKDLVVGGGTVLLVVTIYSGLFNSCLCWSNGLNGVIGHNQYVALGTDAKLQANAEALYPGLVGGGLGAQTIIFLLMWSGGWADRKWWGLGQGRRNETAAPRKTFARTGYQPVNTFESKGGIPLVEMTPKTDHQRS
jgi:hypothetical protein